MCISRQYIKSPIQTLCIVTHTRDVHLHILYIHRRAIWKVASSELLTKHALKKKNIMYKRYVHELLLNVVAAGIEALVVTGNNFLYAHVREVCLL
jgi:hypothetical protein